MVRRFRLTLIAAAVALQCAYGAGNGATSGQLDARMVLQSSCSVSGAGGGNSGINMGTLDFRTQASTFTGIVTATVGDGAGGSGPTQIICSSDVTTLNVTVSAGNNPGQGTSVGVGSRAMAFGSARLPYEVYSDAAMTTPYPTGATAVGVTLPGTGAPFGLPVYGRINKTSANALPAGTYSDALQVLLSW